MTLPAARGSARTAGDQVTLFHGLDGAGQLDGHVGRLNGRGGAINRHKYACEDEASPEKRQFESNRSGSRARNHPFPRLSQCSSKPSRSLPKKSLSFQVMLGTPKIPRAMASLVLASSAWR